VRSTTQLFIEEEIGHTFGEAFSKASIWLSLFFSIDRLYLTHTRSLL